MFTHSHSLTPSILEACGWHLGNSWQKGTRLASCSMELVPPDLLAPYPQGNERKTLRRSSSRKGRSHLTFFPALGIGSAQQRWAEDGLLDKTGVFPGQETMQEGEVHKGPDGAGAGPRTSSVCYPGVGCQMLLAPLPAHPWEAGTVSGRSLNPVVVDQSLLLWDVVKKVGLPVLPGLLGGFSGVGWMK